MGPEGRMNVTVIGAGAIGGLIAARLAASGERVKVVARGAHLAAIRERGLLLKENGEEAVARVEATDRIAEAGGADLIVLAVKAHQLTPIAAEIASIARPSTMLMTTQNGIPWWYFFKHGGAHEGIRLESVDPGGVIASHLPINSVIASIIYPAAEIEAPESSATSRAIACRSPKSTGGRPNASRRSPSSSARRASSRPRFKTCAPKSGPSSGAISPSIQ